MGLAECTLCALSDENCPTAFRCGGTEHHQDLSDFILSDAINYQIDFVATTKLVIKDGDVAGYFSLCSSEVKLKTKERPLSKAQMTVFPAIKLAQLAIQTKYQNFGIGRDIIKYVVGMAISLNESVGCRFVLVDSIPESVPFYQRLGFEKNESYKNRRYPSLRLDIFNDIVD